MSFCKYSTQFVANNNTEVDNLFINDYLPYAPDCCVKVYLYGLYKCNHSDSYDNNIESFSKVLNLSCEDIESCFLYWQEQGLVQILSTIPFEVRFLPVKNSIKGSSKFNEKKYKNFNLQAQEIITDRMITPNEYAEYYTLIESFHLEPEALIMIMKYCSDLKGANIGYNYILTVARNWAKEGIKTTADVEEKLTEFESIGSGLEKILKALGIKRKIGIEEREYMAKWTSVFGFSEDTIVHVAKGLKQKAGGLEKLDIKLKSYYEMKLLSIPEIEAYEVNKSSLFNLAKNVNRGLGIFYENLDVVVENYISKWISFGFEEETILKIANYCFKTSIRTLDGMDSIILKFFKLGLISDKSIDEYLENIVQRDKKIKLILETLGLSRQVTSYDREYYKTWIDNWDVAEDVLEYAISLAKDKIGPMNYLNKILSSWHENKIKTVKEAENFKLPSTGIKQAAYKKREYSKEELNSLITDISEIEV